MIHANAVIHKLLFTAWEPPGYFYILKLKFTVRKSKIEGRLFTKSAQETS